VKVAVLTLPLALLVASASGQQSPQMIQAVNEVQMLRDAVTRETAGDQAGAETILRNILTRNPTSLPAVLMLERVLKVQNRLRDIVPVVDQLLKADPESSTGHQILVRAHASLDQVEDLKKASDAWIKATPKLETPYREISRVWEARGDFARAVQYLEMGRSKIGRDDALALDLGDIYAEMEEFSRAVREWDRAIGQDARGFLLVQRRLSALNDGGAQILPRLIDALLRPPTSTARKRAAAQLAIDAGMSDRAEEIGRATAASLASQERHAFLVEVARRADGAQLPPVAYWAYSELVRLGAAGDQLLALRGRIAELALAMGDTAGAAETYRVLETAYAPGSPERRQAYALRVQLTAREGKLDDAEKELQNFRRDYAEAPELDAIAAALGNAFLEKNALDRADAVLKGVNGPRSGLARSRIALRRGDVASAKSALLSAAPGLRGAEATEAIKLATMLGRVSERGGELMGNALARAAAGAPGEAVALLMNEGKALPGSEPAAIFELAASIAERSQLEPEAEKARRLIIANYARAPEAPAALLALGRTLSHRSETMTEAREHLERLILDHPRSALVPQARQELDRLQGRVPRS
jgi:tetratricopeptide (TPR) repeat protein